MASPFTIERNKNVYLKVMRTFFSTDDNDSDTRDALLIDLRTALGIDDLIHLECLGVVALDPEVNGVREGLKAGPGAGHAHIPPERHLQRAPSVTTSLITSSKGRARIPKGARHQESLPALPSLPSGTSWQDLPAPPPPRSKSKLSKQQGSAAIYPEEPAVLWRQPGKRVPKYPSAGPAALPPARPALPPAGPHLPYPEGDFQARLASSSQPQLQSMLEALTNREAEIQSQLTELDRQEHELDMQPPPPPPTTTRPALPPPMAGGKRIHRPVTVPVTAGGSSSSSMEELQALLQALTHQEQQLFHQILDLDLPDDDLDLDAETALKLQWHRLDRQEHQLQDQLRVVESQLAVA